MVADNKYECDIDYCSQGLVRSTTYNLLRETDFVSRKHRQTIKDGLKDVHRATQAERILALLIESGIVYLTSSVRGP